MSISAPITSSSDTSTPSSSTQATSSNDTLGPDAFLQLMMTQLQDQDPLSPSDPTQYLSELAQFTSVEQETQTAQSASQMASEQGTVAALSLLGHNVNYIDSQGNPQSGSVQQVDLSGSSGPTLTIDGVSGIDPSSINDVS
jgi:flagellar basal-body rod modification protein FlgD